MTEKKKNIFDFINALCYKKDIQYDKKEASSYILSLWLSHDKELIDMVNDINPYLFTLPDEAVWQYYYDKIPKGKRFIKWIKKESMSKEDENKVNELMQQYDISKREAQLSLIGDQ